MSDVEQQWRKAVSLQRKRAVMACFRMIPVYNLSRSAAPYRFICTANLNMFSISCLCQNFFQCSSRCLYWVVERWQGSNTRCRFPQTWSGPILSFPIHSHPFSPLLPFLPFLPPKRNWLKNEPSCQISRSKMVVFERHRRGHTVDRPHYIYSTGRFLYIHLRRRCALCQITLATCYLWTRPLRQSHR